MLPEIRPLTRDDAEAADALATEAFGAPPRALPEPWPHPGTCPWGAFVGPRARRRGHRPRLPVVVRRRRRADRRDRGGRGPARAPGGRAARAALRRAARGRPRARRRRLGALPHRTPGVYRRLGYEIVGERLTDVEVPAEPLTRIPAPAGITLRRADPADERDVAAHRALYVRWAPRAERPADPRGGAAASPSAGATPSPSPSTPEATRWSGTRRGAAPTATRPVPATVAVHELIALAALRPPRRCGGCSAGSRALAGTVRVRTSGADVDAAGAAGRRRGGRCGSGPTACGCSTSPGRSAPAASRRST